MSASHWERVKELVPEALGLSLGQRGAFLDQACGTDQALRREVESLLSVEAGVPDEFLRKQPVRAVAVHALESAAPLACGELFAQRYRLIRKIGEGGMGQVWLADQVEPVRRRVALKLIRAGMYDEQTLVRFQSERQSLAMMDHPAIAKVFDAGATPLGQPYFVMEYVPGPHITEYCDHHKLKIRARLQLFIQACEGVQHAHQKAIIHRDLKPANVLIVEIDGKPVPRIIDFGLAKNTAGAADPANPTILSRFGHFMGTPGYMSPEQMDDKIRDIDTRTDVYSLGVILYVLLTGLQPFETKRRQRPPFDEWLRQLREEEPPAPSTKLHTEQETASATAEARGSNVRELLGEIRGDLDWITMKALERDREQRYAAPLELAADLRRYLNDEAVTARPVSAGHQIRKFVRRHRFATAFIGMVTVLSVVASGAALLAFKQKREAELQRIEAEHQRSQAEHQRSQAEHQTAETLKAQARLLTQAAAQRLKNNDLAGAQGIILEVLTGSAFAQSHTPAAISVFQEIRAADAQLALLSGHGDFVSSARYSPDGARIVTASNDKTARIWDARTGAELLALSGHGDRVNFATYSPDGTRILTASYDKTARIWDARTGTELAVLSGHGDRINFASYSPDGTRIVTASYDKTARIWDAGTGAELLALSGHGDRINSAAYSPDGARIVTASADNTARIWDAHSGAQRAVLSGHTDLVQSAAYSPDGTRIVTASADKTARIWNARTGAPLAVLSGHTDLVQSAAYSPDGSRIVTASADRTTRIWDSRTGAPLVVLSGHGNNVRSAAYSPDGSHIVTASYDKTARIWDARAGAQITMLSGHAGNVYSAAYSPDGSRIVTAATDKTARIWDARSGTQLAVLKGHAGWVEQAAYSPDGTRIVTASADKTARIWDASTGAPLAVLSGHGDLVFSAAYSPDGSRIVSASADKTARIWDAHTGAEVAVLSGHHGWVIRAAYAPDGERIVTASADKTARIWDARTGTQLAVLSGHGPFVESAAYSRDGTLIITASDDKTARIWDARTAAQLAVLSGHGGGVESASYAPDGARIVTASDDKTARIWDARTGAQLAVLSGHGGAVEFAAYSPDGTHIVTASDDKTARIWDARIPAGIAAQIQWDAAAEADPLPDVDRVELGLPRDARVRQWRTPGSACDQAAGAFYDPDRSTRGLAQAAIVADIATATCSAQLTGKTDTARRSYELARALLARSDVKGARQQLEVALAAGYRAAAIDLANLLVDPAAAMLDPSRAAALDQKAWQDKVPIAAFELGRLYEAGVLASRPGAPGKLESDPATAWDWYEKGASVGEPNALARLAARAERNALDQADRSLRNSGLLDAFRLYAAAAERARTEDWPDEAWEAWRHRRASLARILAREGLMQEVADAYGAVLTGGPQAR